MLWKQMLALSRSGGWCLLVLDSLQKLCLKDVGAWKRGFFIFNFLDKEMRERQENHALFPILFI